MLLAGITEKNIKSRNRSTQSAFRKQQLITATIDCIDNLGLSQTTIARIAKHANVSQGIVVFHFRSKDELFEQTLKLLNQEYTDCWQQACEKAECDPVSKLCALVKSVFTPSVCNRKKISVWYAFWGETRSRPKYLAICGDTDKAFSSTLLSQCEQIDDIYDSTLSPITAALSIEGMIDGLWQNYLLNPKGFKRKTAVASVFELMEIIFPNRRDKIRELL